MQNTSPQTSTPFESSDQKRATSPKSAEKSARNKAEQDYQPVLLHSPTQPWESAVTSSFRHELPPSNSMMATVAYPHPSSSFHGHFPASMPGPSASGSASSQAYLFSSAGDSLYHSDAHVQRQAHPYRAPYAIEQQHQPMLRMYTNEENRSTTNAGSLRKRMQSCDICRMRKVKCVRITTEDGMHQRCKQCEANDAKCTYAYVPKKPGPQTSSAKALARKEEKERMGMAGSALSLSGKSGKSTAHASVLLGSSGRQTVTATPLSAGASNPQDLLGRPNHLTGGPSSPSHPHPSMWESHYHTSTPAVFAPAGSAQAMQPASSVFPSQQSQPAGPSEPAWSHQMYPYERGLVDPSTLSTFDEGSVSSYNTSSVSAQPTLASSAMLAGPSSNADSSSPFNSASFGARSRPTSPFSNPSFSGVRSRPGSPLSSIGMPRNPPAPRAACLHSNPSSARSRPCSPLTISAAGSGDHFPPTSSPVAPSSQASSLLAPSPLTHAFGGMNMLGQAQQPFSVQQQPLHSAPPTSAHFVVPTPVPTANWPARNASFSHGMPPHSSAVADGFGPMMASSASSLSLASDAHQPPHSASFIDQNFHWHHQQQQQEQQGAHFSQDDENAGSQWSPMPWSSNTHV